MAGKTQIQGVYTSYRIGKVYSTLRVYVRPANGEQFAVSPENQPLLRKINTHLKDNKMSKEQADSSEYVQKLIEQLILTLKDEHGLRSYKIQERLNLKRKQFDFDKTLDEFEQYKSDVSVGRSYRNSLEQFWLPFFIKEKGCEHPRDFIKFRRDAEKHIKTAKTKFNELYSPKSYSTLCRPINEFMRFCYVDEYIQADEVFNINITNTLHNRKMARLLSKQGKRVEIATTKRSKDTYTLDDLYDIKGKIDEAYKDDEDFKYKAYCLYLGICIGIRRGNLLGLKGGNLHPEAEVPYFEVVDSVLSGWAFKMSGSVVIENATKTSEGETYKIPFIAPDIDTILEVVRFIKARCPDENRLLECYPDTVARWWKKVCKDTGIRYIHPHGWRHSFATMGVLMLEEWFLGKPFLLQRACLHASFRTTEGYLNSKSDEILKVYKKANEKDKLAK